MLNDQPKPKLRDNSEEVKHYLPELMFPSEKHLILHLRRRLAIGESSYGVPLSTHSGRNHIIDAAQEVLDAVLYVMTELVERESFDINLSDRMQTVRSLLMESALLLIEELQYPESVPVPDRSAVCHYAEPDGPSYTVCTHVPVKFLGVDLIPYRIHADKRTCAVCPLFIHKR